MPAASPRRRGANHAASRAITGTLLAPLPRPVTPRQNAADAMPPASPVRIIAAPASARPAAMTARGPYRDASAPPTTDNTRYPARFAVASAPACVLSRPSADCIGARRML